MKLCPKCQKQFSDDANFCPVDAARLVPLEQQTGAADSLASRFDLGPRLGGSRTGAVHRAVDKTTGRPCTVKLVSRAVVALPGVAQRLERELKQLERVQSAGVARVLASGKRGDDTWVAVELLEGAQTLAEAIGARGPIPADQAADLIELVGEALIEAAQVGVVHRDLAAKNILFAGQDVKLINFSLPVPTSEKSPGVPEFLAPEVLEGKPVDQRSNLYSLGALYYYVLTGTPPIPDASGVRPPSQLVSVPAAVEAVIVRALDRSPTKRFLTVRQFVDEVMRVGHGEVIELTKTAADGRAARPKSELVQTLMGFRTGGGMGASIPGAASVPASSAPTQAPMPAVAAAHAPSGRPGANPANQTIYGVPSMGLHAPGGMAAGSNVRPMTPAQGVAAGPAADPNAGRSPWAGPNAVSSPQAATLGPAPAAQVAPPQVAPPQVAAPQVAAPQVAAPQVAAPQVAQAAAGKRRSGEDAKGKFRETMWFKKGDLDVQAAQAAAEEQARTGKVADKDKADSLPLDERYKDDGSISRADKEKYSLRTGATMMMNAMPKGQGGEAGASKVSEDALIGEMKGGRSMVIIAIVLAVAAIIAVVVLIAR
jgi:serine/threonine-protein kinase